jgi:hypothetical protein
VAAFASAEHSSRTELKEGRNLTSTNTPEPSLLSEPLAAVEKALAEAGVTIVRYGPAAALHVLDYRSGLDCLACLGPAGELIFDEWVSPDVFALIESHAALSTTHGGTT